MRQRPNWQVLVGEARTLDYLASLDDGADAGEHPLQELVEELVLTRLTEKERIVYYARFGERASHREIARRMGYRSHRVIQIIEERIMEKLKAALEKRNAAL